MQKGRALVVLSVLMLVVLFVCIVVMLGSALRTDTIHSSGLNIRQYELRYNAGCKMQPVTYHGFWTSESADKSYGDTGLIAWYDITADSCFKVSVGFQIVRVDD